MSCEGRGLPEVARSSLLDRDLRIDRRQGQRAAAEPAFAEALTAPAPRPLFQSLSAPLPAPRAAVERQDPPFEQPSDEELSSAAETDDAAALMSSPVETTSTGAGVSASAPALSAARKADEVHARPASLLRRLLAWTIDGGAIAGLAVLYLSIATAISGAGPRAEGLGGLDAFVARLYAIEGLLIPGIVLIALLGAVYCAVAALFGKTLGRLLTGIRLVDESGHPPAPTRAILRAALSIVSFALFLSGFWLALFDRKGQTLHDKLTSTFVVRPS